MTPRSQDTVHLQNILRAYAGGSASDETRSAVIDVVLQRVACTRVSMWKLAGEAADPHLVCFAAKAAGGAYDGSETRLAPREYREFFETLIDTGAYASSDARGDPVLQALRESYLVPAALGSVLVAAVLLNDRAYGMVCCEDARPGRDWPAGDVVALRVIVNKLALLMWSEPNSVLRTTPSLALHAAPPPAARAAPAGRPDLRR